MFKEGPYFICSCWKCARAGELGSEEVVQACPFCPVLFSVSPPLLLFYTELGDSEPRDELSSDDMLSFLCTQAPVGLLLPVEQGQGLRVGMALSWEAFPLSLEEGSGSWGIRSVTCSGSSRSVKYYA